MTKDELNEILKKQNLRLSSFDDGLGDTDITIMQGNGDYVLTVTDEDSGFSNREMSKETLTAIVEYADTPIAERKPEPQLYNIIIAQDAVTDRPFFTVWGKDDSLGEYSVINSAEQYELLHNDYFKFTVEEIKDLKSKVSEKQKQIINIGTFPVGTDYKKEFAHD